jgi:hypothetical protein
VFWFARLQREGMRSPGRKAGASAVRALSVFIAPCPNLDFYVEFIFALADIWAVQITAITLVFLVLNALLWYARPNGSLWLLGSVVLGGAWAVLFMRAITLRK